ncbi:MAG: hypothetical protein IJT66_05060, partial [Clostridia bacterium]|nr:hypothetical protein [Clostridia bacterium]
MMGSVIFLLVFFFVLIVFLVLIVAIVFFVLIFVLVVFHEKSPRFQGYYEPKQDDLYFNSKTFFGISLCGA